MKKPCDDESFDSLRDKIIGLGEKSLRKSYYPELKQRVTELEETNARLRQEIREREQAEKERQQAQDALRESEERWQFALEGAGEGVWDWDVETSKVFFSRQWKAMLGYEEDEISDALDEWDSRLHPDDREEVYAQLNRHLRGECPVYQCEYRLRSRDGEWRWILDRGKTIGWTPDGRPCRVIGTHVDITEHKRAEEELRKSKADLEKAQVLAQMGCWSWDLASNRMQWSDQMYRILGVEKGTCPQDMEQLVADFIHPDDRATFQKAALAAIQERNFDPLECRIVRPDGEVRVTRSEAGELLPDEAGNPAVLNGVTYDITRRRQAEEALRQSEERFQSLFNRIQDGVYRTTADGRFLEFNTALMKMLGYECREEMQALDVRKDLYFDPEEREGQRLDSGQEPVDVYRLRRKDGSEVWVEDHGHCVFDSEGRILFHEGILRDITERKRAEETLRESEEMYRALLKALPDIVIRFDRQGRHLFVSENAEAEFGLPVQEHIGKTFAELGFPESSNRFCEEEIAQVFESGLPCEVELLLERSGRKRFLNWRLVPERDAQGQVCSVLSVSRDVTDIHQGEEERKRLQEQLAQAQKMESVGRLAGGVAHDFNNMLAAILGHAEMALEQVSSEHPLFTDLRGIQNAAQRSADLTRQLLAFARKQTVMPKILNLNDTVGGMLKMLGRLIGEDIELVWSPGSALWSVKMDPSQIDQILANLCVNARDAIGGGVGRITIETSNVAFDEAYCASHADSVPGEYVMLAVSDNGCGMDKKTQERLFEPFFTTKGVGQGTGLGLATVYGIVKQNNGIVNVYSELGEGTTFKLYWPRHVGKTESNPVESSRTPVVGGQETILMVEDEPAIRVMCRAMIEKLGYRVIAASTPGEAIRLAEEHAGQIHLLMTDVIMPEMNGRELARRLLSLYPDLKCLFMSGYTANVIAHHGVLDEGVLFLQKPFTLKDLSTKVRAALSGGCSPESV
jgi:PAS domain S-box-containing protein